MLPLVHCTASYIIQHNLRVQIQCNLIFIFNFIIIIFPGEMRTNLLHVNAEIMFRFFGILPWKLIPTQ